MATVQVKWLEGRQFVGIGSSQRSVVMSSQAEPDTTIGISPSQLLLIGLGGCTAYDVVEILEKKRQTLTRLEVVVNGEQDENPPRAYRKIHVEYRLRGRGLSEKAVAQAIRLSEEKYCSVAATLRGVAEITTGFTITEEE